MPTIITLAELTTPDTVNTVLAMELSLATQFNLPVTSWQPLDPSRTIFQINANLVAQESQLVASIAQGGYISYAAIMPAGTSPYNDGAGYLTTWMDLIGVNNFNVSRIEPSAAAGPIPVTNTTATAQTYVAGQLHFQHPTSGATYTNTAEGTVGASGSSTIQVAADPAFVGPIGSLSVGQTAIMLTPFPGVTPTAQTVGLVGTAIEQNAHYLVRCEAKLGALSPNGPAQAYFYVATSLPVFGTTLIPPTDISDLAESTNASIANAAQALLNALGFTAGSQYYTAPTSTNPWGVVSPVTRVSAVLNTGAGVIDVYAANAAGGLTGCAQLAISNVTWSSGSGGVATVTTSAAHGLGPGAWVIISAVAGATGVNNQIAGTVAWQLVTASGSTFTFALATNPGSYTSGGSVEGGDLGMVDAAIQAQVVPDGQTALTLAASNVTVNLSPTVYIPTKAGITSTAASANIQAAVTAYLGNIPIGGVNAETKGIVPGSELLVVIANANPSTVSVQPTPSDVSLSSSQVPVAGTIAPTIIFV
jgi:hypothetical protein